MLRTAIDPEAVNLIDCPQLTGTPERRLLLAILERAILDYVGNDEQEVAESESWIFDDLEQPSYENFTFSWVCLQLDLEPKKIAATIKSMPRRGNQRVAPWYFTRQQQGGAKLARAC